MDGFFREEVLDKLIAIEEAIGSNYTPSADKVLRFTTLDLSAVKIIVLGRDPYPKPNVATGRAFEVGGITSWSEPGEASLRNILKSIHKAYTGTEKVLGISEVRQEIEQNRFCIPAPNEVFTYWERQGVLFLNTAFTCEMGGKPGSHNKYWYRFFPELMTYIYQSNSNIQYFLWGKAKKYESTLKELGASDDKLYTSHHPSSNGDSGGYENGTNFSNCPCFRDTKDIVNWIGTLS